MCFVVTYHLWWKQANYRDSNSDSDNDIWTSCYLENSCQQRKIIVEIVPSHEWHLNFSPKLHQWRLSNGLEAIAEGHLRVWTDAIWGEKFKCHECTEQFLINTIKYWQNPFHLEEGKSQISQVWKKTSQFDRRQISNNTGFEKINLFYAT